MECDMVMVGCGIPDLSAAIAAAHAGTKVADLSGRGGISRDIRPPSAKRQRSTVVFLY
jgi:hypothetical protein